MTPPNEGGRPGKRTASKKSSTAPKATPNPNGRAGPPQVLVDYLVGRPGDDGEWKAHCPLHEDNDPSASFNFGKGVWCCRSAGCHDGRASIDRLTGELQLQQRLEDGFVPGYVAEPRSTNGSRPRQKGADELPSAANLKGWHQRLLGDADALAYLTEQRGLSVDAIKRFRLGLHASGNRDAYVIPVHDTDGNLVNVRYHRPARGGERSRYWGVSSHNSARLYPVEVLSQTDEVVFCEGEFDALLLNDRGIPAITTTGGAGQKPWRSEWTPLFRGKTVHRLPDSDGPGRLWAQEVDKALRPVASAVTFVALPYEVTEGHGEDVTDYLVRDAHSVDDLRALIDAASDDLPWDDEPDVGADDLEADVLVQMRRIQVYEEARDRVRHEREASRLVLPLSRATLADDLAADLPSLRFTVTDLHPTGANSLFNAKYKAGKTTLLLNLLRSLVDGEPFLDRFDIQRPQGRVGFWNYELTERQFVAWLSDIGVQQPQRAATWTLRGHRLPLLVPAAEDAAVRWLEERDVTFLIIDPYARAVSGSADENSNTDANAFLETLDVIKRRAGVEDLVLVTHGGRGEGEHSRGATRLDDWADIRWHLAAKDGTRFFKAHGRDVHVPEQSLAFDPATRRLTMGGPSRKERDYEAKLPKLLRIVRDEPGISTRDLKAAIGGSGTDAVELIRSAVDHGFLRVDKGAKHAHYLTDKGAELAKDRISIDAVEVSS